MYKPVSSRSGRFTTDIDTIRYPETGVRDHTVNVNYGGDDDLLDDTDPESSGGDFARPKLLYDRPGGGPIPKNPESHSSLDDESERIIPNNDMEPEKIYKSRPGGVYTYSDTAHTEVPTSNTYAKATKELTPVEEEPREPEMQASEPDEEPKEDEVRPAEMPKENEVRPIEPVEPVEAPTGPSGPKAPASTVEDVASSGIAKLGGEAETASKGIVGKIGEFAGSKVGTALGHTVAVVPAAYNVYQDIKAHKIVGANWQEKAANVLTPLALGASFIPGAGTVIGGIGDLAAAGLSIWGEQEEKDKAADALKQKLAVPAKQAVMPTNTTLSDLGSYTNQSLKSVGAGMQQTQGGSF